MGVIRFIGSLPGKAVRAVGGVRKELALRARGTAYVTQHGQIRINTNPDPSVKGMINDVFVSAATNTRVGRAVTHAVTEVTSHPHVGPITDDLGTDTAVRLGVKVFGKIKRLVAGS